jgi:2-polyprenyl-6-hydroxyphenyl methylase/3-demethylubiquinone-9 3-methyltransferase
LLSIIGGGDRMMISLDNYWLSIDEREALESLLAQAAQDISLKELYRIMDEIWPSYGCDPSCYDEKKYAQFYSHPILLLNGIFV